MPWLKFGCFVSRHMQRIVGACSQATPTLKCGLLLPQGWGLQGFYGPPYALLQGSLDASAANPPHENAVPIRYSTCGGFDDLLPHPSQR